MVAGQAVKVRCVRDVTAALLAWCLAEPRAKVKAAFFPSAHDLERSHKPLSTLTVRRLSWHIVAPEAACAAIRRLLPPCTSWTGSADPREVLALEADRAQSYRLRVLEEPTACAGARAPAWLGEEKQDDDDSELHDAGGWDASLPCANMACPGACKKYSASEDPLPAAMQFGGPRHVRHHVVDVARAPAEVQTCFLNHVVTVLWRHATDCNAACQPLLELQWFTRGSPAQDWYAETTGLFRLTDDPEAGQSAPPTWSPPAVSRYTAKQPRRSRPSGSATDTSTWLGSPRRSSARSFKTVDSDPAPVWEQSYLFADRADPDTP
jgi:hypothetical protein